VFHRRLLEPVQGRVGIGGCRKQRRGPHRPPLGPERGHRALGGGSHEGEHGLPRSFVDPRAERPRVAGGDRPLLAVGVDQQRQPRHVRRPVVIRMLEHGARLLKRLERPAGAIPDHRRLPQRQVAGRADRFGAIDRLHREPRLAGRGEIPRVCRQRAVRVRLERQRSDELPPRAAPVPVVEQPDEAEDRAGVGDVLERDGAQRGAARLRQRRGRRQFARAGKVEIGAGQRVVRFGKARVEADRFAEARHAAPPSVAAVAQVGEPLLECGARRRRRRLARMRRVCGRRLDQEERDDRGPEPTARGQEPVAGCRLPVGGCRFSPRRDCDVVANRAHVGDEAVPAPRDGLDEARAARAVAERLAHLRDAEVQVALEIDEPAIVPDVLAELVARHEYAVVGDEQAECLQRLTGQVDQATLPAKLARHVVQLEHAERPDRHGASIQRADDRRPTPMADAASCLCVCRCSTGVCALTYNWFEHDAADPLPSAQERGRLMRTLGQTLAVALAAALAACGSDTGNPNSPSMAITVSANPAQITGAACTGCGAGSTDREALTTLQIQETAGVAGTVAAIDMSLREQGTNAVIGAGSFDAAAIAQLAGSNRVPARGTLNVRCGVHYPAGQAGKSAILTYTVRVTDDRGNQVTQTVAVAATT